MSTHVYARHQTDGFWSITPKPLVQAVRGALPGKEFRTDLRDTVVTIIFAVQLTPAEIVALDAAVAAIPFDPLMDMKLRKIREVIGYTAELLGQGFDFEGRVYLFSDYLHRATPPARFVARGNRFVLRLADAARITAFQTAATAAERTIMQQEATTVQSILDAVDEAGVAAVVDPRSPP